MEYLLYIWGLHPSMGAHQPAVGESSGVRISVPFIDENVQPIYSSFWRLSSGRLNQHAQQTPIAAGNVIVYWPCARLQRLPERLKRVL